MTEGLSVRFSNLLSPPSLRDTSPYHKGRHGNGAHHHPFIKKGRHRGGVSRHLLCHNGRQGWWCETSFAIRRGREEGKTQARQSIAPYICVSLVPCESGHVKTRRYKQDAKGADFAQGVYIEVHDQAKTQTRQCIALYIRVSLVPCESGHVKTRRYKQDAKGADFAQGVYIEVHDQAKTQTRQSIALYIRVSPNKTNKAEKTAPVGKPFALLFLSL